MCESVKIIRGSTHPGLSAPLYRDNAALPFGEQNRQIPPGISNNGQADRAYIARLGAVQPQESRLA